MNTKQLRYFYSLLKELGYNEDNKRTLIHSFSQGRTTSSKELNPSEASNLLIYLSKEAEKRDSGSQVFEPDNKFLLKIKYHGVRACGYQKGEIPDWKHRVIPYICKAAKVENWQTIQQMDNKNLNKLLKKLKEVGDWQERKRFEEKELNRALAEAGITKPKKD